MKKSINFLGRLASIIAIVAMSTLVSCDLFNEEDDDNIDDIIDDGTSLDDGYYIVGSAISSDTTEANLLTQGQVNAPDFSSQDRSGFFEGYVYIGSGSFSFIRVNGEEITELGGSNSMMEDGDPDPITIYVGQYFEGGAAATVPFQGLAHVSIDQTTGQYVVIPVEYWEIIGDATEGGWSTGTELAEVSSSAEEVVYQGTNVVLRPGQFKFRFNSNWSMNLEEGECDAAEEACLNYFTNFGGTLNSPVHGGGNFVHEDEGAYTVTVTYTPGEGVNSMEFALERTGDAPEITFDPAEYQFGIIGDATANGWDADMNMYYKGQVDGAHTWLTVVTFGETGAFKFRTNDAWDFNLGGTLPADGSAGSLTSNGADIATPGAGAYYITLSTADEGTTWNSTMVANGWGIIGEGSPQGNWDADIDLNVDGFADGVTTYSITGDFTTANWKFRANDAWDYNLGGDMAALSPDGADLSVAEDGNYTVVLSYDGETYSVSMTKN